ncbi:MAG: 4Fe-4S cluster-binding domain-containing protein [Deltaproteobacteria bacterium]|nr:4Fe-4S cluster-binding domain-containing protein [Deltaproteobacteria bacterium]
MNVELHEIFSSLQGEGPYTGTPMTFVRLQGCPFTCRWCDTPHALALHALHARVETPPRSRTFAAHPNPVTAAQLNAWMTDFDDPWLAITGGEPLVQAAFLASWLPTVHAARRVLLETAGLQAQALAKVAPHVDVISMDLKLPSSTGMRAFWEEHAAFIRVAAQSGKERYAKIIVTHATTAEELATAMHLIQRHDPTLRVFLQPATATAHYAAAPDESQLTAWRQQCQGVLPNVAIGRQMHKAWNML